MNATERTDLRRLLQERRPAIARAWQRAIAPTGLAEISPAEVGRELTRLTDEAIALLLDGTFAPARARDIGAALVRLRYFAPESLGRTQHLLGWQLVAELSAAHLIAVQPRLLLLLGEVGTGFVAAARETILAEQAALRASQLTEEEQLEALVQVSMEAAARATYDALARDIRPIPAAPTAPPTAAKGDAEPALTRREGEILSRIADGERNTEIAERLSIAVSTVESHVAHILRKLGARSRTEAARHARRQDHPSPDPPHA